MSHAVRTLEPNQPKDNVTPIHTLWDNCCTQFEDTQLECTFLKYKICTVYIRPTVLGVYMLVLDILLDISCHLLGDECKLDSFCAPFGRRDGK